MRRIHALQRELPLPLEVQQLQHDLPVDDGHQHQQVQRNGGHVVVHVDFPDRDVPPRRRVVHVVMRHDFVRDERREADQQDQHVDLINEAQHDRDAELHAHQRMHQRLAQPRGALDAGRAVAAPVDEARDAPERQQSVQDQVDQQLISAGHSFASASEQRP
jgi:hypothetical protein